MGEEPNREFLKPLFNEELNSGGIIKIAGSSFLRSRILSELEKVTYDVAFQEWVELRKQSMLERANDILALADNRNRFNALKKEIKGNGVIPFVGAGLSMPSGYPGWTEFLWKMQTGSHVPKDDLDELLIRGDYEAAVQLLYDDLGPGLFNKQLEETYLRSNEIIGAVHFLPEVFLSTNVVTTNFDFVLEDIFKDKEQGFDQVIYGNSLPEVLRIFHDKARLLVRMHGTCNIIANRVLLHSEYEKAYAGVGDVRDFLSEFMFARSFLFLGCSLSTDRPLQVMEDVVKAKGESKVRYHYAFLELKATDDMIKRKKALAKANIFPIWYPENENDQSVEALFMALMED